MRFTRAIVRRPAGSFASGLTSSGEGPPDVAKALAQHQGYCDALRDCGLALTFVEPDLAHADGTFVEDTAVVTGRGAILARPGAPSRGGEVDSVAASLRELYPEMPRIAAPGTLDGGDVCEADGHYLIGVSARTNEAGARQLAQFLRGMRCTTSIVDIRSIGGLLHLKTGIAYLGGGLWLTVEALQDVVRSWTGAGARALVAVGPADSYAANCVRVNDAVLVAAGYPRVAEALRDRGLRPILLEMSEFRKMDGGLSCLSLRL